MKPGEIEGDIAADMTHCAGLIENGRGDLAARYLRNLATHLLTGNYALRPLFASEVPATCDHRRIRDGAAGMGKVCRDCGMLGSPTGACTWREPNTAERAFHGIPEKL